MIGKIVTGKSFRGAVEYVLKKENARLLDADGVDTSSVAAVIASFNFQRKVRPEKAQVVGHISLSFHKDDAEQLSDELMRELAAAYMDRMGITDTQYIVARHSDTEHPHLHIIYNRVRYDGLLIKSHNERFRNVVVCKELKQQYELTFSQGKENVKVEKLHTPDKVKYEIYETVKEALPRCASVEELADEIFDRNRIRLDLIHRGNDLAKEVQGVTFTKDGITFKGSQVDQKFSYGALLKTIAEENRKREQERQDTPPLSESEVELLKFICGEQYDPTKLLQEDWDKIAEGERSNRRTVVPAVEVTRPVVGLRQNVVVRPAAPKQQNTEENVGSAAPERHNTEEGVGPIVREHPNVVEAVRPAAPERPKIDRIENYHLSPEEQKRLYSPDGLTLIRTLKDERQTIRFTVNRKDANHDILLQCLLATEKINRNPVIFDIQLTDEQITTIKEGEPIYLKGMQNKGRTFDGYLVMNDTLEYGRAFTKEDPRTWVKYGKYEMRLMDKLLIEAGFITRAIVKWWGGMGQTARPYLWKQNPSDTEYKESWNDPRLPKQKPKIETYDPIIPKQKKGRGI